MNQTIENMVLPFEPRRSSRFLSENQFVDAREKKASRPKYTYDLLKSCAMVLCPHCDTQIPNPKGKSDTAILTWHNAQTKCFMNPSLRTHDKKMDAGDGTGCEGFFDDMDDYDENSSGSDVDEDEGSAGAGSDSDSDEDGREIGKDEEEDVVDIGVELGDAVPKFSLNSRCTENAGKLLQAYSRDPQALQPRYDILEWQSEWKEVFSGTNNSVKFRNISRNGSLESVNWIDLAKIYEFGLAVNLSDAEGTLLLLLLQDIFDRHDSKIQLRSTWESLKIALTKQKVKKAYEVKHYSFPLPPEHFGEVNVTTGKNLKPFRTTAVNIFCIVADRLLNVKRKSNFKTRFQKSDITPRSEQVLGGFSTGRLFERISDVYEKYADFEGLRVVPILLEINWDDTTTSSSQGDSQCPVYVKILNIEGEENKYELLGFGPRHCPYSKAHMRKQLEENGYKKKQHIVSKLFINLNINAKNGR